MKVYVVTAPESARGIYATWPECRAVVAGLPGARFQAVSSREAAEALLRGEGVTLTPGTYAFVDGNHLGGIGVVLVTQPARGAARVLREVAMTAHEAFGPAGLARLDSRPKITAALDGLRNILTELGALYTALRLVKAGAAVTVVHDYEGVGAWMEGRWKTRDPLVTDLVAACRALAAERHLTVAFRRQRGHESTFAGRNDFAAFNARADRLATQAALRRW